MSEIAERLRKFVSVVDMKAHVEVYPATWNQIIQERNEAADHIERLEAALRELWYASGDRDIADRLGISTLVEVRQATRVLLSTAEKKE